MGGLSFYKRNKKISARLLTEIAIWLLEIAVVLIIAFTAVHYFGQKRDHLGDSMSPTIKEEDSVLLNQFLYLVSRPKRFDIIVYKSNGNQNSSDLMSRVIGLPGETIQIKKGILYIDEKPLEYHGKEITIDNPGIAENPIELGLEEYFVIGDNRSNIDDSRNADIGNVKINYIEGKAWLRLKSDRSFSLLK